MKRITLLSNVLPVVFRVENRKQEIAQVCKQQELSIDETLRKDEELQ